jgi:cobalamin synthase
VDSFLSAVHHFTGFRIPRFAEHPMDAAALAWSPIVGLLAAILTVSFYIPLAAFYVPPDVAIILALVAISWIRGFKAEIDFCDLCDSFLGRKKSISRRWIAGIPGITCLIFAALLRYAIARQFFLLESARLLALGTFVPFVVPSFSPERAARIKLLGGSWLLVSAITALAPVKLLSAASALFGLRGPLLTFALIYLSARLTFHLADEPAPLNVAALPSELAAYLSFILVRYHFL